MRIEKEGTQIEKNIRSRERLLNQRGVTALMVAVMMLGFLGLAALAVDVGFTLVTRNQLQNVSDAASLAATRTLGAIYEPMSYTEQQSYVCDPATIIPVAQTVALENPAAGKTITVNDADIIIGEWNANTRVLTPTLNQPNAVRVTARRDSTAMSLEGPITTFFGKIFGINTLDVKAGATAALTAQSTVESGNVIPVGISEEWFRNKEVFCDQVIKFYPTNTPEGCAGWNTYERWPASEEYLRKDILQAWLNDPAHPPAPSAGTGDQFVFTGGTLGNQTFTAFFNLWDYMRKNDGDGNDSQWTAQVVVYKSDSCENPHGLMEIAGFATVIITNVVPPNVEITAKVICENIEPGHGGGGEYGTKGSIPGLVE